MEEIKFRQAVFNSDGSFHEWHYWGFIYWYGRIVFSGPMTLLRKPKGALEDSYQFTGLTDCVGKDVYAGDVLNGQWEVFWDKVTAMFKCKSREGVELQCAFLLANKLAIIGNVVENPGIMDKR